MKTQYELSCAWCGCVIRFSDQKDSHGICRQCELHMLGLPDLTPDELDALPFGVIGLDRDGIVRVYNRAESTLSGQLSGDVVGQNFFAAVAPCTKVKAFEGRFIELVEGRLTGPVTFRFEFRFPGHATAVTIVLSQCEPNEPGSPAVWVTVMGRTAAAA